MRAVTWVVTWLKFVLPAASCGFSWLSDINVPKVGEKSRFQRSGGEKNLGSKIERRSI